MPTMKKIIETANRRYAERMAEYAAELGKPLRWVRLACIDCDDETFDLVTESELAASGYQEVGQVQTYAEATTGAGSEWWTHLGYCSECVAQGSLK